MFALRRQMQRNVVAASRRHFGADAQHGSNPARMEFDEWKGYITKLHGNAATEAEKAQIAARFKEARLQSHEVQAFHDRLRIQTMTDAEFAAFRQQIHESPYAHTHPLTTKYKDAVALADRTNKPRPDMFKVAPQHPKVYTKDELGNGTVAQARMNDYIYEMQTNAVTQTKYGGGLGLDLLDMQSTQKQSLVYLGASVLFALYGGYLYRHLYMEKYNLADMANWEVRVITARAFKERGW